MRTLLHVGFAHSGTTSLQQNFFSLRRDIFHCTSTDSHGGILSAIKYEEDWSATEKTVQTWCNSHIWTRIAPAQSLVISDENLIEQPEVYYSPPKVPIAEVATRLKRLFPNARILFTVRNQLDYVISSYLNLKRNYAYLSNRSIESFDDWFAGNHSQIVNRFLRNLDYSRAIAAFAGAFRREAVAILPLETLDRVGAKAYLQAVADLFGAAITETDVENFQPARNRRLSQIEDGMLGRWQDAEVRALYDALAASLGPEQLRQHLDDGERAMIRLTDDQTAIIYERCARGNAALDREFGLDLAGLGYPIESGARSVARRARSALGRIGAGIAAG